MLFGGLAGTAMLCAVLAAAWAGFLALAEESPAGSRGLSDPPGRTHQPVPLARVLYVSRMALLTLAGVCAAEAVRWWERSFLEGAELVVTGSLFLYLVGEALPRATAALAPELANAALPIARRTLAPFRPLLGLVGAVERWAARLLPASTGAATLEPAQRDILLGVFALGDTTVAEVMTPRLDVMGLDVRAEWDDVVEGFRTTEHSRLLVFTDTLDNINGIVHAKDIVPAIVGVAPVPARWQDAIRPAQFVPESKTIAAQLRDFQRGAGNLAVVVDEFGGTSGIITLEDILEEVIGEIRDEYDTDEEPSIRREGDDRFWVEGRASLDELSAVLGTRFERPDVTTVGGWIYSELGHVPRQGEELKVGGFRVVVDQVHRRRVRRVFFERQPAETVTAAERGA